MDSGDSYIVEMLDGVAHEFGGDESFFGYGDVASACGDNCNYAFTVAFAIALQNDGASEWAIFSFWDFGGDGFVLFERGAGGEDVAFCVMDRETVEDAGYLRGCFALSEDDFGHADTKSTMVVNLGEAKIFEGKMTEAGDGFVRGKLLGPDLREKSVEGSGVHDWSL